MAALDEDLRRQVVGRSTEGVSLRVALEHLREAEVRQADVPILVHQDVLRLQVTVDDVLGVEMTECHGDLNGVEAGTLLREASHLSQVHEKFTATNESHHEENLLLRLEHVAHTDKEGVIGLEQDVLFESSRLNLVVLDDHVLSQRLHRVHLVRTSLLHQEHFSERATTNDRFDDEVGESDILVKLGIHERRSVVAGCRKGIVLISRAAKVLIGWLVRKWLVRVLVAQAETLRGHLV